MSGHQRRRILDTDVPCLLALLLASCGAGGSDQGASGPDTTPPARGTVYDGQGADIDSQSDTTTIHANWQGFSDSSGIQQYEWGIASVSGEIVLDWTYAGTEQQATRSGLQLVPGNIYVVLVRAKDQAGNLSLPAFSDGVRIEGGGGGGQILASQVSQHGITWRFAAPRPVGKFCNGDWWVLAPVDIVEITPHSVVQNGRTMHGSMLDPMPIREQGYDSTLFGQFATSYWRPALNVAMDVSASQPLRLGSASSLVSTISNETAHPNGSISELRTAAVLTVLDQEPPFDAFRPGYVGTDKTIRHRESDLDYGAVAALPIPAGTPPITEIEPWFERIWLDHMPSWVSRHMHPAENMKDYSRDFAAHTGHAALQLNLDRPLAEKRTLMVRLTQLGIDNWANVSNGCVWAPTGGQCSGRKFPIVFAGAVLGDPAMAGVGSSHQTVFLGPNHGSNFYCFGEDGQVFYVQQTGPNEFNHGYGGYSLSDVGMPEWGNSHAFDISNDHRDWGTDPYRRCCTANAWLGYGLAMRVMNLQASWNQPAFFDYLDRYVTQESSGWTMAWDPWQATMWNLYRNMF
jgi:hypothetical protein